MIVTRRQCEDPSELPLTAGLFIFDVYNVPNPWGLRRSVACGRVAGALVFSKANQIVRVEGVPECVENVLTLSPCN